MALPLIILCFALIQFKNQCYIQCLHIDMGYGAYIIFAKFRILFPDTLAKLGTLGYLCVSVGCEQCNHYNQNMKPFYSIFSEKLF